MIYLMAPYTHEQHTVCQQRFELITLVLGELMQQFPYDWVFSPITQGHVTVPFLPPVVAHSHKFWMQQCEHALREADRVMLLPLPGWRESKGITQELDWCAEWDKPVVLLDAFDFLRRQALVCRASAAATWLRHYSPAEHVRQLVTENPAIVQLYRLSTKTLMAHTETAEHE